MIQFGEFIRYYEEPSLMKIAEGTKTLSEQVKKSIEDNGYKEDQFEFRIFLQYIPAYLMPSFTAPEDFGVKVTLGIRADYKEE